MRAITIWAVLATTAPLQASAQTQQTTAFRGPAATSSELRTSTIVAWNTDRSDRNDRVMWFGSPPADWLLVIVGVIGFFVALRTLSHLRTQTEAAKVAADAGKVARRLPPTVRDLHARLCIDGARRYALG